MGRWVALVGLPVGAWFTRPEIGLALVAVGIAFAVLVAGTALFGSDRHSDRAFRLLRWFAGRPKPSPKAVQRNDRK